MYEGRTLKSAEIILSGVGGKRENDGGDGPNQYINVTMKPSVQLLHANNCFFFKKKITMNATFYEGT
jgi:hypothetical protein